MSNSEYLKRTIEALSKSMDYQWKLQSYNNKDKKKATRAICVAYIDARDVTRRLNEACEHGWHREHIALGNDKYCRIGLVMPDGSIIWRADVGESDNETETSKTAASDSFKRAAVQFGVGLFLYDVEAVTVAVKLEGEYVNPVDDKGGRIYNLTKHINSLNKFTKTVPQTPITPVQPTALPELIIGSDNYKYVVKRLKEGVSLTTIKKTFTITAELETKLTNEL